MEEIKNLENTHSITNSDEDRLKLKEKREKLEKIRTIEIEKLMRFTQQEEYDGGL